MLETIPIFLFIVVGVFLIILLILWFLLPFAVFGTKVKLNDLINETKKTNDRLRKMEALQQYAETLQQPCCWADLDWVAWSGQYRHVPPRPMLEKIIPDFTPVFSSDDYLVQKAAISAGLGAMLMSRPMGFEQSNLVRIDIGIDLPSRKFYIVCAKSMRQVPRVKMVAKHLVNALNS